MLQQRKSKTCLVQHDEAFVCRQHSNGFKKSIGSMDAKQGECILMAMNGMMSSSTEVNLFSDGKGMRSQWYHTTKMAMSQFHHQALQYLKSSSFHLILITHDTSTFYAHDCRKNIWSDKSDPHAPE